MNINKNRCWLTEGYGCPYNINDCYKCFDKPNNIFCRFNEGFCRKGYLVNWYIRKCVCSPNTDNECYDCMSGN